MTTPTPKVSIGMPVYNGEATLGAALDSLVDQTFSDIEIIISDNASTDGTEAICREYARHDPRIRYIRQQSNIGATGNFKYVYDAAKAPYFMWAASDDVRSPNYLEINVTFLNQNPDYVASTSPTKFSGGSFDPDKMGDRPLENEDAGERLCAFFGPWHANGLFYSLMRTNVLRGCDLLQENFVASDWAIVLFLAKAGKLGRQEKGSVELGTGGFSNTGNIFSKLRISPIEYVFPFHYLTRTSLSLCDGMSLNMKMRVFRACLVMNFRAHRYFYERVRDPAFVRLKAWVR